MDAALAEATPCASSGLPRCPRLPALATALTAAVEAYLRHLDEALTGWPMAGKRQRPWTPSSLCAGGACGAARAASCISTAARRSGGAPYVGGRVSGTRGINKNLACQRLRSLSTLPHGAQLCLHGGERRPSGMGQQGRATAPGFGWKACRFQRHKAHAAQLRTPGVPETRRPVRQQWCERALAACSRISRHDLSLIQCGCAVCARTTFAL